MTSNAAAELTALRCWDVHGDVEVERAALGTMNEVFIVGRGVPQFVLRGHRYADRRLIELEHDVMERARIAGVPAPRGVPARDGDRFVFVNGRYWSLLEWLPGDHVTRARFTALHARSMGETLAVIHSALASLPPVSGEMRLNEATAQTVERIDRLLRLIEALPTPGYDDELAGGWLRAQRAWLMERTAQPVPPRHDSQVIHGDYHDANVLFDDDLVVGVIDWDKAGTRSPSEEVIRCVHLSFDLEVEATGAFFDGYRRRRPLSDDQLDAAAMRYGYERDRSIWLFDQLYTRGNERLRRLISERPFTPFEASRSELCAHL